MTSLLLAFHSGNVLKLEIWQLHICALYFSLTLLLHAHTGWHSIVYCCWCNTSNIIFRTALLQDMILEQCSTVDILMVHWVTWLVCDKRWLWQLLNLSLSLLKVRTLVLCWCVYIIGFLPLCVSRSTVFVNICFCLFGQCSPALSCLCSLLCQTTYVLFLFQNQSFLIDRNYET